MNIRHISIVTLLLLSPACTRHPDQRTTQAKRARTLVASTSPVVSAQPALPAQFASGPPTPDPFLSRPSPFDPLPEPERQLPPVSQPAAKPSKTASAAPAPRKALKPFTPIVADASRTPMNLPPAPPAPHAATAPAASKLNLGHKTCCVGTATFEPARPARLQRVLARVPGLRRIHQTPDSADGYVAPRPAREISLVLPPEAGAALARGTMDLKASVDESGRVTRVELLSPKDEELVRLASYAAGAWPFLPARINDKAVPGEVILHFTFGM